MTDLEMCVELARFMGWPEFGESTEVPSWWNGGAYIWLSTGFDPGEPKVCRWEPMVNASQAAMVMAEAMRRGFEVETRMSWSSGCASAAVWRGGVELLDSKSVEYCGDPVTAWAQAVSTAVLRAIPKMGAA